MARQVNKAGLELVKRFEGLHTQAYRCPAGIWTIGYGHTSGVKPGTEVTAKQAEQLLNEDLLESGGRVEQLVKVPLTDNQFSALVSFTFNAGAGSLQASTLLRRLNTRDYDGVPVELAKWVKATDPRTGQKVALPGLVRRRAAEADLWLQTETDDPFLCSPDMPQKVQVDEPGLLYTVIARKGLKLREGPGISSKASQALPYNTTLFVVKEKDGWAAVDLQGDGGIDGWMSLDFLAPVRG